MSQSGNTRARPCYRYWRTPEGGSHKTKAILARRAVSLVGRRTCAHVQFRAKRVLPYQRVYRNRQKENRLFRHERTSKLQLRLGIRDPVHVRARLLSKALGSTGSATRYRKRRFSPTWPADYKSV